MVCTTKRAGGVGCSEIPIRHIYEETFSLDFLLILIFVSNVINNFFFVVRDQKNKWNFFQKTTTKTQKY